MKKVDINRLQKALDVLNSLDDEDYDSLRDYGCLPVSTRLEMGKIMQAVEEINDERKGDKMKLSEHEKEIIIERRKNLAGWGGADDAKNGWEANPDGQYYAEIYMAAYNQHAKGKGPSKCK